MRPITSSNRRMFAPEQNDGSRPVSTSTRSASFASNASSSAYNSAAISAPSALRVSAWSSVTSKTPSVRWTSMKSPVMRLLQGRGMFGILWSPPSAVQRGDTRRAILGAPIRERAQAMRLNTEYLDRSIATLEGAFVLLQEHAPKTPAHDIYRAACVKEFEIVEELCGVLLKKRIAVYFAGNREADALTFKDVFRHAARHVLISADACERWLAYRDTRNDTAHRYGENYANDVLAVLPAFIEDAKALSIVIGEETG